MLAEDFYCESYFLVENTFAAIFVMLGLNLFGFVFFGISMGYTWSLIFCLQFIAMMPYLNMYIPSCLNFYHKTLELVNGNYKLIRDNFLGRTYSHYELEPLKPLNW